MYDTDTQIQEQVIARLVAGRPNAEALAMFVRYQFQVDKSREEMVTDRFMYATFGVW